MDIGKVLVDFIGHSGFIIKSKGIRIAIDPYSISEGIEKVDVILITHGHYDHCSLKDIEKLCKKGTIIIMSADAQSKITKLKNVEMHTAEPGDKFDLAGIKIDAIPAYNIDKEFHSKRENWCGYVIKIGDVIVYHSGDSDNISEMKNLSGYGKRGNTFIILLPVSGKYVMDVDEAVKVVEMLKPSVAIPMHYGSNVIGTIEDAKNFVRRCREKKLNAMILEKI